MTIHRIRMLGDPILRTRCEPIAKPGSAAVRVIIDDLRDTLRDFQSRFGYGRALAAPQIGAPVRIVFVEMEKPWALINPEIVEISDESQTGDEGCLSFPDVFVPVKRGMRAKVRAQDLDGNVFEAEGEGLYARAMQHEGDHLNGRLLIDQVGPVKRELIKRKLRKDAEAEREERAEAEERTTERNRSAG